MTDPAEQPRSNAAVPAPGDAAEPLQPTSVPQAAEPEPPLAEALGAGGAAPATGPAGSGHAVPPAVPTAQARRSRWIGLVWAVPLAALLIVGFLGVRALANRGIEVVVTFDSAAGARVDDTKVIYLGVEAGSVTNIAIAPDGRHVDMTLLMDPKSEPGLTTSTRFWLIGAKASLQDISSSVKAAVAGLTIGVAPGVGGTPTRRFQGLSEPPVVLPGTPGTPLVLISEKLSSARAGTSLYFHGLEVGKVTSVRFASRNQFLLDVYLFAPYDRLVSRSATFWIASPLQVTLTDRGLNANVERAGALFTGAIELDIPPPGSGDPSPAAPGTQFPLYPSREEADVGPLGPQLPYAFRFDGPAGELAVGAPVRVLGFQIGAVSSVQLHADPASGNLNTVVVAQLYPQKLLVAAPPAASATVGDSAAAVRGAAAPAGAASAPPSAVDMAAWRRATDAALTAPAWRRATARSWRRSRR